ncbi:Mediator complex subunit Med21 [Penicillium sp. IBT 16267x]|nr:Mediator complex subunit Med21 [Penicillium sp. IBT 16267x]
MADILTQLQTCLDQLATQFYATLGYLSTYHDNSPALPPPNVPNAVPALAKISKTSTSPPIPASLAAKGGSSEAAGHASPPPQPPQQPGAAGLGAGPPPEGEDPNQPPQPDSPRLFASRQRELARDLIIKEQQIEYLISVLPGIGASEAEQEAKIRELEVQLRDVEREREVKVGELSVLKKRLESVLGAVSVGVYADREYKE